MSARRVVVFTCDSCGRVAEVEPGATTPTNPPDGWTMAPTGAVTCDRHQPAVVPAPDEAAGFARLKLRLPVALLDGAPRPMTIDPRSYMAELRATGPSPIPFRSARLDLDVAPGRSTWTFVVPVEFVELEPEA